MKHLFSIKTLRDFVVMIIGTAIFAFAIVYLNIPNDLAEGGITGITLILRALF